MAAFLADLRYGDQEPKSKFICNSLSANSSGLKILELGSGCGIAGIAFAQLWPQCQVFLTDLTEAMDVLESNIGQAAPAAGTHLSCALLDWGEAFPEALRSIIFDVVLVSDCTYNSDSIPALVKTFSMIAATSPNVLLLVSLKVRHSSEAIFFELLIAAGFRELGHTSVSLPTRGMSTTDQALYDNIEIYGYQWME